MPLHLIITLVIILHALMLCLKPALLDLLQALLSLQSRGYCGLEGIAMAVTRPTEW